MFGYGNYYLDNMMMMNEAGMLGAAACPPYYVPGVSDIKHARLSGKLLADTVNIRSQKERDKNLGMHFAIGGAVLTTALLIAGKLKDVIQRFKKAPKV